MTVLSPINVEAIRLIKSSITSR